MFLRVLTTEGLQLVNSDSIVRVLTPPDDSTTATGAKIVLVNGATLQIDRQEAARFLAALDSDTVDLPHLDEQGNVEKAAKEPGKPRRQPGPPTAAAEPPKAA